MSWGREIIRALFLTLGVTQIITNLLYLTNKNGITLARKQHQEVPTTITDKQMKVKVICMLCSGIAFTCVSLLSYLQHGYLKLPIMIVSFVFCLYAISEALYYKYWRTFGFMFLSIIIAFFTSIV